MTDTQPDVVYVPMVTWYKPEQIASTAECYCHNRAVGRTAYWDGRALRYLYHCGEHLPAASARFEDGVPA